MAYSHSRDDAGIELGDSKTNTPMQDLDMRPAREIERSPSVLPTPVMSSLETQQLAARALEALQADATMADSVNSLNDQPREIVSTERSTPARILPFIPSLLPDLEPERADLIVVLSEKYLTFNYRVDSGVLRKDSVKLRELLQRADQDFTGITGSRLTYFLCLQDRVDGGMPQFVARPLPDLIGICEGQTSEPIGASMAEDFKIENIKKEDGAEAVAAPRHHPISPTRHAEAYLDMLIMLHEPCQDLETPDSLSITLTRVEAIAKVAAYYDTLPLLRIRLRDVLSTIDDEHARTAILNAIKDDPPRWLHLSIQLQNVQWFREAIVHVIGAYPLGMPHWSLLTNFDLPSKVMDVIQKKSCDLKTQLKTLAFDLCLNSLKDKETGKRVSYSNNYEQYVAQETWRNWLQDELDKYHAHPGIGHRFEPVMSDIGRLLRNIQQGGKHCYDAEAELEETRAVDRNHHFDEYMQDVKKVMRNASKAVMNSGLTRSTLELPLAGTVGKMPTSGDHMVGYLICSEITRDDTPWLKPRRGQL